MNVLTVDAALELARSAVSADAHELPVLVVDLRPESNTDTALLGDLPYVVVGLGAESDPGAGDVDVLVTDEDEASRIVGAVDAHPIAALVLVRQLRVVSGMSVEAGLVAESAAYSALLGGPEHAAWLAARGPARTAPDAEDERVRVTREDGVLRVGLTRASRRNAVDAAMQQAIVDALCVAVADPSLAVRVDGEGPCFSSGGDLDEFGTAADPASAHLLRVTRSPARLLAQLAGRTTVHVHGPCYGAGVEWAAFAGTVVAMPDATFTLPEVGMGLIPGAGGTVSVTRRIGRERTAWLALTGTTIDATTAQSWGLVDAVGGGNTWGGAELASHETEHP